MVAQSEKKDIPLSIVIASGAGGEFLLRCLDSLRSQAASPGVEVIVVDRCGEEVISRISKEHPYVRLLRPDVSNHRPSVPELRAQGVREAKGTVVAIVEEHCVVPTHWVETLSLIHI